jgi:predicted MPP superfamily phosphohydrolase
MMVDRRSLLKTLAAAAVGGVTGSIAHGYWYERHGLVLEHVRLPVTGLAAEHEGLRIGFLTDLHHSAFVSQEDIARAATLVMTGRPDLIVLGGDYVTNFDAQYMQPCAEALAALSAQHGIFAILGNHDDERRAPAVLARTGFAVLKDAWTSVMVKGVPLELVGISFWTRDAGRIARILQGATKTTLLLAHDPRRLEQAMNLGVPGVLSGHTHGGQVVLPAVGAIAARRFPLVAGLGRLKGTAIYVSRGVGTVFLPVRINCPPEVALVTLVRR